MYRLMIVDDEKTIRETLPKAIAFESYGFYVCAIAANGEDAMVKLRETKPQLILLDICMPILDGIGFLQQLRESEYKDTRVAILSGFSEFGYAQKALRYGVRAYLTKPLDEDDIYPFLEEMRTELEEQEIGIEDIGSDGRLISEIVDYATEHFRENINVQALAEKYFMNPAYLGRVFRKETGMPYKQYINNLRINEAKMLLRKTDKKIYEVGRQVGFSECKHFIERFIKEVGCSPSEYRNRYMEDGKV